VGDPGGKHDKMVIGSQGASGLLRDCSALLSVTFLCACGCESGKISARKEREEKRNRYKKILPGNISS
jgi:hypothetical protein